jgi:hypothetical protein
LFVAVSVQISQRYLKHTALQAVSSDLYIITTKLGIDVRQLENETTEAVWTAGAAILTLTSGSVAGSDGGVADVEDGGNVDVVPFLLLEGVSPI